MSNTSAILLQENVTILCDTYDALFKDKLSNISAILLQENVTILCDTHRF